MTTPYSYRTDPSVPPFPDDRPVLVFDGHCVMCSGSARFVLRHDKRQLFRLLPAQTGLGRALYVHYRLDPETLETVMLLQDGHASMRSEAAIRTAALLGFPWSMAGVLRIVPLRWRDRVYEWVARNRYRLFGRREICMRPEPGQAARFLS